MIDQSNRAGKSGFSKFTLHPCFQVFSFNFKLLKILFCFYCKITTDGGLKMSSPRSILLPVDLIPFWFLILTTQSRNLSEYCIATNTNRLEPSVCGLKTAPCDGDPRHSLTPSSFLFLHHSTSSNFWLHDAKIDQHQSGLSLSLFLFHVLVFLLLYILF